jgi:hypothetical protein
MAKDLLEYHGKTVGLLIGGTNRKQEQIKLDKGKILIIRGEFTGMHTW